LCDIPWYSTSKHCKTNDLQFTRGKYNQLFIIPVGGGPDGGGATGPGGGGPTEGAPVGDEPE